MKRPIDVDRDEARFLGEFVESISALQSRAEQCPPPETLLAVGAGVLPAEVATPVSDHLRACPICQALARDLADAEIASPTATERARIGATVAAGTGRPRERTRRWWAWRLMPLPAAVAIVVAVAGVLWLSRTPPGPTPSVAPGPTAAAVQSAPALPAAPATMPSPPRLPLEKPAVRLPLATVLVWRGEAGASGEPRLADLGRALAPYQAGDYAAAAPLLEEVARRYESPEASFYLGVSRLFLGQHEDAIKALLDVRKTPTPSLSRDTAWYLAVAYERAGRQDAMTNELQSLCREAGSRQAEACAALGQGSPGR